MINAIPHCRKKFKKIYGVICDSYFQNGFVSETEQFDAITAAIKTNTPESFTKARTTATLLKESLTELGREKHTAKADLFAKHLAESLDATKQLEASLKPGSAENPAKILAMVKGTCAKCHHETRDLP